MKFLKLSFHVCLIFTLWTTLVPDLKALQKTKETEPVRIGLLIPDNKSLAALHGAEMAIRKANENGGFKGRPFQLVVRSMEGPWGKGSKEAVNLIFEENVCAIMGSHDGRNAHLVEQVTTKARIVFLSAWSSDPTLSQAFVPWYFSCVPNDLQQANALIEEIYNKRKYSKIAALSDKSYDSESAIKSFVKKTLLAGKTDPLQFFYEDTTRDFNSLIDKIDKTDVNCIILFGKPPASKELIQQIRRRKMSQTVFGSLAILDENELSDQELKDFESVVLVSSAHLINSKGLAFRDEFQRTYGRLPGVVAAYAFDGMSLLLEAVRKAGTGHEKIQKSLKEISFEGVTGQIQFDDKGNRSGEVVLIEVKNGTPAAIDR